MTPTTWLTLDERKKRAIETLSREVEGLCEELRAYAASCGGRFFLFGSAATGRLSFDSDVDLIVDFPDDRETAAWRFAEDACWRRNLDPDVRPLRFCTEKFIDKIMPNAKVLQ